MLSSIDAKLLTNQIIEEDKDMSSEIKELENQDFEIDWSKNCIRENLENQLSYILTSIHIAAYKGKYYCECNFLKEADIDIIIKLIEAGYIILVRQEQQDYSFYLCWDKEKFFEKQERKEWLQILDMEIWKLVKYIINNNKGKDITKTLDWVKSVVDFNLGFTEEVV